MMAQKAPIMMAQKCKNNAMSAREIEKIEVGTPAQSQNLVLVVQHSQSNPVPLLRNFYTRQKLQILEERDLM